MVISFLAHNVCTESQGTSLMVDQWPNTEVMFSLPTAKIINFQLDITHADTDGYCKDACSIKTSMYEILTDISAGLTWCRVQEKNFNRSS